MDRYRTLLQHCLGDEGYETLSKAIFRRGTNNVADPLELYLPLMVVPRALLSWLVQNIAPMKTGENKDLRFPGRDDIMIHIIKDNTDVYRGEFVQGGKIIHEFEKQTLPSMGGHLMSVGEQYSHLTDGASPGDHMASPNAGVEKPEGKTVDELVQQESAKSPELDEPKAQGFELPKSIIDMAVPHDEHHDSEAEKWMWAHANVRELTGTIGKLVDALVSKKVESDAIGKVMDEIDKEEIISEKITDKELGEIQGKDADAQPRPDPKDEPQGREARDAHVAGEKPLKKEGMAEVTPKKDPTTISEKITDKELGQIQGKDADLQPRPDPKETLQGKEARSAKLQSEKPLTKDGLAESRPVTPRISPNAYFRSRKSEPTGAPVPTGATPQPLSKPYVSDAQRRWAHTPTGTKALGGQAHVHEWDESTKGKKLPEHVSKGSLGEGASLMHSELDKAGMMPNKPGGAAIPKGPSTPQMPKPAVAPSRNPAGAAARQSMQSAQGGGGPKPPKVPGAPKMPGAKPPAMKSEQYFRSKLTSKHEAHIVTDEEVYAPCEHCGVPEFKKSEQGPVYSPCHCFRITLGGNKSFVKLSKVESGYVMTFDDQADSDSVKAFLLTLKSQLLLKKHLRDYEE